MPKNHTTTGKEGELFARDYLEKKGYIIKACNWRFGKVELDIIAEQGDFLVIIEVKTRANNPLLSPEKAVTPQKIKRICSATDAYISSKSIDKEVRFDIIALTKKRNGYDIKHLEDAFYFF